MSRTKNIFLDKNKDFRDSTSRNLWKALLIFTYCLVSDAFFHFDLNHRHLFLLSLNKIWLANASLPRHKILNLINHFDLNCLINLCWWVNDIQNMNFLIILKLAIHFWHDFLFFSTLTAFVYKKLKALSQNRRLSPDGCWNHHIQFFHSTFVISPPKFPE